MTEKKINFTENHSDIKSISTLYSNSFHRDEDLKPSSSDKKTDANSINSLDKSLENEIEKLPKPNLSNLPFIERKTTIYSNLYQIVFSKNYNLYEYALEFKNEKMGDEIASYLKKKIILSNDEIYKTYGDIICIGNSFYAFKKLEGGLQFISKYNQRTYEFLVKPTNLIIEIRNDPKFMMEEYNEGKKVIKSILEIIFREILRHNPALKYVMKLFSNKNQEENIDAYYNYNNITLMPGYNIKVLVLESGFYFNVDIKTQILSQFNCKKLIDSFTEDGNKKLTKELKKEINEYFEGKTIETIHTHQRFKIERVNFDRNINNTELKHNGESMSMKTFFKKIFDINLKGNSPILDIYNKNKHHFCKLEFPPELAVLVGLDEEKKNDLNLTKKITNKSKLEPTEKIEKIKDILDLINEKKVKIPKKYKQNDNNKFERKYLSSYEIKNLYGIDLINKNENSNFPAYILKSPIFLGYKDHIIHNISKPFELNSSKKINYVCFYHKIYENYKFQLKEIIKKSKVSYGISFGSEDYIAINSEDINDWIKQINKSNSDPKKKYNIFLFLFDNYLHDSSLYDDIKKYTNEKKGILTQFILTKSLEKNSLSIMSNILIQIQSKLGGISYKINFPKEIKENNFMIIGVDSSKKIIDKIEYQSISYVSTINKDLNVYTSKKENVLKDNYSNLNLPISVFIKEALEEYYNYNEKTFPNGIIIYRQGISLGQRDYIKEEVESINNVLSGEINHIPFYYILVNKKSSLKFFEKGEVKKYENPENGLLVCDTIVENNTFQFYIQPQKVNQGSATPTEYTVLYGNLNCAKILPKLTYDLCYYYLNWRGAVRIPAVLKYAEKLAKVNYNINKKNKNNIPYL